MSSKALITGICIYIEGSHPNLLFAKLSEEISLVPRGDVPIGAYFLLALIALELFPSKLETGESMMSYSPQQILQKFGFDLGAVWIMGSTCVSV